MNGCTTELKPVTSRPERDIKKCHFSDGKTSTTAMTRREQQLVGLIRLGLSNKEIGSRLNLSEQTVKNHIHRILRKVGANDRLEIVELCQSENGELVTALRSA